MQSLYDQKLGKLVGNVVIAALHAAERSLYTEISTEIGESITGKNSIDGNGASAEE